MAGLKSASRLTIFLVGLLVFSAVLTACGAKPPSSSNYAQVPAGKGFADGNEIFFSHTETSDPGVAEKLTNMMKSPVLLVPSLAEVPKSSLAEVYVFENGIAGKGPLGFQADVFNKPPETAGYSPLRQIIFAKWNDGITPLELKSETEILQAEKDGKLTLSESGIVVNMPFMVWSGGQR